MAESFTSNEVTFRLARFRRRVPRSRAAPHAVLGLWGVGQDVLESGGRGPLLAEALAHRRGVRERAGGIGKTAWYAAAGVARPLRVDPRTSTWSRIGRPGEGECRGTSTPVPGAFRGLSAAWTGKALTALKETNALVRAHPLSTR